MQHFAFRWVYPALSNMCQSAGRPTVQQFSSSLLVIRSIPPLQLIPRSENFILAGARTPNGIKRSFWNSSSPLFLRDNTLPKMSGGRTMDPGEQSRPPPATSHTWFAVFRFLCMSGAHVSNVSLNRI